MLGGSSVRVLLQQPCWYLSVRQVNNANIKATYKRSLPAWYRAKGNKPGYPVSNPAMLRVIGVDKNLQERINELYKEEISQLKNRTDIGFPAASSDSLTRISAEQKKQLRRNPELERASRLGKLEVCVDDVQAANVQSGALLEQIFQAADLYGVFEDLFGVNQYFKPCLQLRVEYDINDEHILPVHRGNIIKPFEAAKCPRVEFNVSKEDENSFWTLVLTNPDGHFQEEEAEYIHWMVGNIPGNRVDQGQVLVPYVQPFPAFGTGYHRFVFVLFKHEKPLDLSSYDLSNEKKVSLASRTFKTGRFHEKYASSMKPAGLAFFQSDYDSSLHHFFHNVLEMREPRFEYNFIPSYIKPWLKEDPGRHEPFNIFLDKMRDPKEIQEEVLKKKLARCHPFDGDLDRHIQFPNAHGPQIYRYQDVDEHGSWRIREMERERLRQGVFKDMDWTKLRMDPRAE